MASIINWTKQDKMALQKAVNNFNSKIKRLEKQGYTNLPERVSVRQLTNINDLENRRAIYSRRELRATINRLRRFSKRGSEQYIRLAGGEIVTMYEKREIMYAKSRAVRQINKRIQDLENLHKFRIGMSTREIDILEATRNKILSVETRRGADFRQTRELLDYNAYSDYDLRQSNIWRINFINSLKESNLKNKNLLISKLKSFKNPRLAYEYLTKSQVLQDLWFYYKEDSDAQTYGGFETNQDAFNFGLQELGLLEGA